MVAVSLKNQTRSGAESDNTVEITQPTAHADIFFKQKTAYEIGVRLVGSEMCIRDSINTGTWSKKAMTEAKKVGFDVLEAVSYTHLTLPTTPYV